jgi:hypothetical protein
VLSMLVAALEQQTGYNTPFAPFKNKTYCSWKTPTFSTDQDFQGLQNVFKFSGGRHRKSLHSIVFQKIIDQTLKDVYNYEFKFPFVNWSSGKNIRQIWNELKISTRIFYIARYNTIFFCQLNPIF